MVSVDIQKIIAEKVRYDIEMDIRIGGYIEGSEPNLETAAEAKWTGLTKEEAETLIKAIAVFTNDIAENGDT